MKKVLSLLVLVLFLCSCKGKESNDKMKYRDSGIWLSYYEITSMLKNESGFKAEFERVIENCKKLQIQNLYIHIRPFADSLYQSDYFPLMEAVAKYDYDVFDYMIEKCHKSDLKVHAWINPYRVSTATGNIEEIKSYLETDTPTIYLGRCEYVPLPTSVDSERILFDLDEEYCSETGCENYIYEGVTDEQVQWLEDKLSDVMIEFHKMIGLKPCWFRVVEQEEIDLCECQKEKR